MFSVSLPLVFPRPGVSITIIGDSFDELCHVVTRPLTSEDSYSMSAETLKLSGYPINELAIEDFP